MTNKDYDYDIHICNIKRFKKITWQKRTTSSLIRFADNIVRICQFVLNVKWKNHNNAQMCKREVKHKQKEAE